MTEILLEMLVSLSSGWSYLMEALLAAVPFRPTKKCSRSRFLLISRTSRSSREAQEDVEEVEEAVEVHAFSALFGDPTALKDDLNGWSRDYLRISS